MYNEYRFVDRWFVRAPLEAAYDVIGDTVGYPAWWGDVFISVDGDDGPPRPGRHVRIVSRGLLPYRLRWEAEIVDAEAPHGFSFTMTGDFVGSGSWSFEPAEDGTNAVFEFRPRVEKPGVKQLSPLLKPVFRWNHRWAMERGERGLDALLSSGGGDDERKGEPVQRVT